MSQSDFYTILDACIGRIRQGESLESCLADYPEQAADLAPTLSVTADLLILLPMEAAPEAVQRGREQMMMALENQESPSRLWAWFVLGTQKLASSFKGQNGAAGLPVLRTAVLLLAVLILGGGFAITAITASADSLPGDLLYPVKRGWETTQFTFTRDEAAQQTLQTKLDERRRQEVRDVVDLKRSVVVVFHGRIASQSEETWLIDNINVQITEKTDIEKGLIAGAYVTIRAQVHEDGLLTALEIWGDGRPSLPTPETQSPAATLAPTHTPTSTLEATLQPALTPTPTHEPTSEPGVTDEPTATTTPTHEPTATQPPDEPTREPTATHRPTHEPTATQPADEPTATRIPTHEPTATYPPDEPTATHEPTSEPTTTRESDRPPTATHEPTPTPPSDGAGGD